MKSKIERLLEQLGYLFQNRAVTKFRHTTVLEVLEVLENHMPPADWWIIFVPFVITESKIVMFL